MNRALCACGVMVLTCVAAFSAQAADWPLLKEAQRPDLDPGLGQEPISVKPKISDVPYEAVFQIRQNQFPACSPGNGEIKDVGDLLSTDGKCAMVFVPAVVEGKMAALVFALGVEKRERGSALEALEKEGGISAIAMAPQLLLDAGREINGAIRIQSKAPFPVEVIVAFGESAAEALDLVRANKRVIPPGDPTVIPNRGFRFVRIVFVKTAGPGGAPQTAALDSIEMLAALKPVTYHGSFSCSDHLLTRIWYQGAYAVRLCMQRDGIWDGPKRDAQVWIGDAHPQVRVAALVFADKTSAQLTLAKYSKKPLSGGQIVSGHCNEYPNYSCAWLACLNDNYLFSGDEAFARSQRDYLVGMLDFLKGELDERGVYANVRKNRGNHVDWCKAVDRGGDGKGNKDNEAATHLFLASTTGESAKLLRSLGDSEAERINRWDAELRLAAVKHLLRADQTFGSTFHANAMAVYGGTAPMESISPIFERVLSVPQVIADEKIGAQRSTRSPTPFYNYCVGEAMAESGHVRETLDFIRAYWGHMIKNGATSWWEFHPKVHEVPIDRIPQDWHSVCTLNPWAKGLNRFFPSLAHGWGCGPTIILTRRVLGVWPSKPGLSEVLIHPDLGDLEWAEGTVPVPDAKCGEVRGLIRLRHEKKDKSFVSQIALPDGVSAQVELKKFFGAASRMHESPKEAGVATETSGNFCFQIKGPGHFVFIEEAD